MRGRKNLSNWEDPKGWRWVSGVYNEAGQLVEEKWHGVTGQVRKTTWDMSGYLSRALFSVYTGGGKPDRTVVHKNPNALRKG